MRLSLAGLPSLFFALSAAHGSVPGASGKIKPNPPQRAFAGARIDREVFSALNTYPPLPTQPRAFSSLESFQKTSTRQGGGSTVKEGLAGRIADRNRGGLKGVRMRHPAKVMPLAMALSVTTAMVPQAIAQTPPAAPPAQQQTQPPSQAQQPSQQTQSQQQQSGKGSANRARGAAGGAVIGGMMGNAGAGAVIGAGHSRRQQRRDNRHQQ